MRVAKNLKRSLKKLEPSRAYQVLQRSTWLGVSALGFVGLASIVIAAVTEGALFGHYITFSFVVFAFFVPLLGFLGGLGILLSGFFKELHSITVREHGTAEFLSGLQAASTATSKSSSSFMRLLLDEWHQQVSDFAKGRVVCERGYWEVCKELFPLCTREYECTSTIPLERWDKDDANGDKELLDYSEALEGLVGRGVKVKRTFIVDAEMQRDKDQIKRLLSIGTAQEQQGTQVYALTASELGGESIQKIRQDFSLIDGYLLMYGVINRRTNTPLQYEFYDLDNPQVAELIATERPEVLEIFDKPTIQNSADRRLFMSVSGRRSRLRDLRFFTEPLKQEYSLLDEVSKKND